MKAGITIYLSLVLVLILALIFAMLESGRVSAIRAKARSAAWMAADSSFAEFAQPVFDRYGIMFLWEEEEEFRKTFEGYLKNTLDLAGTGVGYDMDLYGLQYKSSEMKGAERITDDGGAPFLKQVTSYMQVHAAEGLAETLLSRSKVFQQSEKTREVLGKINAYQESFAKVEESAVKIYEKTQKIKDLSENPRSILDVLEEAWEDPDEAKEELGRQKKEWKKTEKQLKQEVEDLEKEHAAYQEETAGVQEVAKEMEDAFDLNETEFDPEIYHAIQSRVQGLSKLAKTDGAQYLEIAGNTKNASEWVKKTEAMNTYFEQAEEALARGDTEAGRALTRTLKETLDEPDLSMNEAGTTAEGGEKASAGFIRKINKTYKKGVLDLFADEISEKEVEKKELPSETVSSKKMENKENSFPEATVEKALFCEYIREHFNCFTKKKRETVLDYEAEYILGGKKSDRENLSVVCGELVLLRSGANMVSILMDCKKMAEIEELALSFAGASGQVYIAKIAEILILTAWSLAESMLDVRALLQGKKVPVLKQEGDWNFSLQGLRNFTGEETPEKDSGRGLDYSEYLLVLLLMEGKSNQIFRTMDAIQMNMCAEETERFRIRDCLVSVQVVADFSAPGVFAAFLPGAREKAGDDGYTFSFLQEYAYQ